MSILLGVENNPGCSGLMVLTRLFTCHIMPNMAETPAHAADPLSFFAQPSNPRHRRYEILRAFFVDQIPAGELARRFDCSRAAVYSIVRDYRRLDDPADFFFRSPDALGRSPRTPSADLHDEIVRLRKLNLSVPDIKARLDAASHNSPSERAICDLLDAEGFARLPRRSRSLRASAGPAPERAPESAALAPRAADRFQSERAAGILCFLPLLRRYRLDEAIQLAGYPGTSTCSPLQSVLAFLALKLSHIRRYSADDICCMDRGPGLFAGLNVLPKSAWFSSYSDRTTRAMNQRLLAQLTRIFAARDLVSQTANLDFTTLPHWGNDATLEKHWAGSRGRALTGFSAALAQDPDSGLLLRSDASVRRHSSPDSVLEFLDFSHAGGLQLRYLVFDGRFTTYACLQRLHQAGIRFVTVRRRGRNLVHAAQAAPPAQRKQVRVPVRNGTRLLEVVESITPLRDYDGEIRQIAVLHGAHRPALLITNDFNSSLSTLLRRYAQRWLVEKSISEQLAFFHLNRLSSSMVIKVDFDLALTVLAYNLYRLLARELPLGYHHCTAPTLFESLLETGADIQLAPDLCTVSLKKKRNLLALIEALGSAPSQPLPWLGNRRLAFNGASRT